MNPRKHPPSNRCHAIPFGAGCRLPRVLQVGVILIVLEVKL